MNCSWQTNLIEQPHSLASTGWHVSQKSHLYLNVLMYLVMGLTGGATFGFVGCSAEQISFHFCRWLETRGIIRRVLPDRKIFEDQDWSNFLSMSIPYVPLSCWLAYQWREGHFFDRMQLTVPPLLHLWGFLWAGMVLHDAWFYFMHRALHASRAAYRRVHAKHHRTGATCSTLGTSYGEVADVGVCFAGFHWLLAAGLAAAPSWNLPAVALLATVEVAVNNLGHTGYDCPRWLEGLVSGGVLSVTPLAGRASTHYIHHLDSRVNRGLYFTWWDRLAGTHADTHPLLQRQAEAEARAVQAEE